MEQGHPERRKAAALGNRIIECRFDEAGNVAHEERFDPVRLWRGPETGGERPAPWLWY